MINLKYALLPEIDEAGQRKETTTTMVEMEDVTPEIVAHEINQLHEQNIDITVNLRLKEPK